ncbi:helix-turn-helix domain-containing protein [Nakamurella deserti]|uniref:helix-turn-helix domain-containing protein n=1 Tax=Nakamurella deserti TaxID=2164074 RepID=UPI000DBEA869|nr:helix-turn-helix domain-containing protein [Nakamurella deserti]
MTHVQALKGARITGPDRAALAAEVCRRYRDGESIRSLAAQTGRSYGFVHGLLVDSAVPLRSRGGPTRRRTPA